MAATVPQIDVRRIEPRRRHALVYMTFQDLAEGESMELVSDHDPVALRSHFDVLAPDESSWDAVERGPGTWRVAITRVRPAPAGSCCGACGGGGH